MKNVYVWLRGGEFFTFNCSAVSVYEGWMNFYETGVRDAFAAVNMSDVLVWSNNYLQVSRSSK